VAELAGWVELALEERARPTGRRVIRPLMADPQGQRPSVFSCGADEATLLVRPDWPAIRSGTMTSGMIVLTHERQRQRGGDADGDDRRSVTLAVGEGERGQGWWR